MINECVVFVKGKEERDIAVINLQKLLRGRGIQYEVFIFTLLDLYFVYVNSIFTPCVLWFS